MEGERACDADALALAPAEGVGKPPHVLGPQADAAQEIRHALFTLPPVLHAVDEQRLADEIEQRHARIERRERILEDHLHLAPQRSHLRRAQRAHLDHRAGRDAQEDFAARRLDRTEDAARRRRLAAAALADEAERLALVDVEVDPVDRAHVALRTLQEALPDRKELLQFLDPQQRGLVRAHA
jgi:hypothetical protein